MEHSKETIFLGKLELILSKFNDLDSLFGELNKLIEEQPSNQQQIDWELSDYYHKLEDENTTDVEFVNIGKKIQHARLIRGDYQRTYELIKAYKEVKDKLFYSPATNREDFRTSIQNAMKYLHEDYKYRILTEKQLKDLKVDINKNKKPVVNDKKYKISKEDLLQCIKSGMNGTDIAKKYDVNPSTVTRLKERYGLKVNKHKKKRG